MDSIGGMLNSIGKMPKTHCKDWGVGQKLTTSYHPQTNLTERVNKTLKTMIASFVGDNYSNWDQWLPELRFAINSAHHESTGVTPAQLMLGRSLKDCYINHRPRIKLPIHC